MFDVFLDIDKNRSFSVSRMELTGGLSNYHYDKSVDLWMLLAQTSQQSISLAAFYKLFRDIGLVTVQLYSRTENYYPLLTKFYILYQESA